MTDEIRQQLKDRIQSLGISHSQAGRDAGLSKKMIHMMLAGTRGVVPKAWVQLFDVLGYELTLKEKDLGRRH